MSVVRVLIGVVWKMGVLCSSSSCWVVFRLWCLLLFLLLGGGCVVRESVCLSGWVEEVGCMVFVVLVCYMFVVMFVRLWCWCSVVMF